MKTQLLVVFSILMFLSASESLAWDHLDIAEVKGDNTPVYFENSVCAYARKGQEVWVDHYDESSGRVYFVLNDYNHQFGSDKVGLSMDASMLGDNTGLYGAEISESFSDLSESGVPNATPASAFTSKPRATTEVYPLRQSVTPYPQTENDSSPVNDYSAGFNDNSLMRYFAPGIQFLSTGFGIGLCGFLISLSYLILDYFYLRHRTPRSESKTKLQGVGGWLLLLCIWVTIVGPLLFFAKLSEIATSDYQWYFGISTILFSIITGILLWSGQRIGWKIANIYFWSILALGWFYVLMNNSAQQIGNAIVTSIISGFWLLYLNNSKRVYNTYLSDPENKLTRVAETSVNSLDVELRSLAKLHDDGIITDEEFELKKRKMLNI